MLSIARDIRSTIRGWLREPGSACAALATLTIGIGATTAIFSVLNSLMLSPLPVPDSAHLFRVIRYNGNNQPIQLSMPDALDLKRRLEPVSSFSFYRRSIRNLADRSRPAMVHVLEADEDLFHVMGIRMAQGQRFHAGANKPGRECEAVISWPYWQNRFGGGNVTGSTIRLNGRSCLIDGVLPKALDLPMPADFWIAGTFNLSDVSNGRRIRSWYAVARTKAGVSAEVLNAALGAIGKELAEEHKAEDEGLRFKGILLRDWLTQGVRKSALILFAAVFGVLLMACANVANLLLSKALVRMREISVRVAVGASRGRLFRQLLTESLLLALASSLLGLIGTVLAVRLIRSLPYTGIPRPESIVVDWRVMLFAIGLAAFTGILFGTLPALRVSMVSLTGILKQTGGRITETLRQQTTRKMLVGTETAIATVLLISSLLLVRSFAEVVGTYPGFEADHLLTAYLSLPPEVYGKDTMDLDRLAKRLVERLSRREGVKAATVTTNVPLESLNGSAPVQVEGKLLPEHENDSIDVMETNVTPDFRKTLKIAQLAGRDLEQSDDREHAGAILVNATFARTFFPQQNAVGKRLRFNPIVNKDAQWQQVVGVLADTRQNGLEGTVQPEIYVPLARGSGPFPAVIIRTQDAPGLHLGDIESAVHEVDPEIAVFSARTMEQVESRSVGLRILNTALLGGFALMALLLTAMGIFAVIAYSVSQRTSEIGVRMACGATEHDVIVMMIRQGVVPALLGIGAGALAAYAVTRYLASLLYNVKVTDATSYAAAIFLLIAVSIAAGVLPARRAARLHPWQALRYE